MNCLTSEIMFSSDLSNRVVEVSKGIFIDRDLNSAINIAKKCKVTWLDHLPNFDLDKMYLNNSGKLESLDMRGVNSQNRVVYMKLK